MKILNKLIPKKINLADINPERIPPPPYEFHGHWYCPCWIEPPHFSDPPLDVAIGNHLKILKEKVTEVKHPEKMKNITKAIKMLQNIEKNGGEISSFSLSAGIRVMMPGEKEWNEKDYSAGFAQRKPDGSFSLSAYGNFKQYEPTTRHQKQIRKKKGKERSN